MVRNLSVLLIGYLEVINLDSCFESMTAEVNIPVFDSNLHSANYENGRAMMHRALQYYCPLAACRTTSIISYHTSCNKMSVIFIRVTTLF